MHFLLFGVSYLEYGPGIVYVDYVVVYVDKKTGHTITRHTHLTAVHVTRE